MEHCQEICHGHIRKSTWWISGTSRDRWALSQEGLLTSSRIFRDIAGDYSDGVDTLPETRDRLRDLLDGYGEAAPSDISQPLRAIVAGLTQGDIDSATDGIGDLGSACLSRAY